MKKEFSHRCHRLLNQYRSPAGLVLARRPCRLSSHGSAAETTAGSCARVKVVARIAALGARGNVLMAAVAEVDAAAVADAVAAAHAGVTPDAREQLSWMPWLN